jgi:hypothetical protein
VGRKETRRKVIDVENVFSCAEGDGIFREEVWVNAKNEVVKYNLAFLLPHIFRKDNGRVLGYDNAHGIHERHYRGSAKEVPFRDYLTTLTRFIEEVRNIRSSYESKNIH